MNLLSSSLAVLAVVGLGIFWPSLKVNYQGTFAKKFLLPVVVVATVSCVPLFSAFGWWVLVIYPAAFLSGSVLASWLLSGKRMHFFLLGGGIWLSGATSTVAAVVSLLVHLGSSN